MATQEAIDALADAMGQLLDDMGADGTGVCLYAKAKARIAYEPFCDYADWEPEMSYAAADEETMTEPLTGDAAPCSHLCYCERGANRAEIARLNIMKDEFQYPETWQKSIAHAEELGRAREENRHLRSVVDELRTMEGIQKRDAEIARLRAALKGIAEYCSGDDRTLGAIARLAAVRNTAEQALRVHEQKEPT